MAHPRERFGRGRARSLRRPAEDDTDRFLDEEDGEDDGGFEEDDEEVVDRAPRRAARSRAPRRSAGGPSRRGSERRPMEWDEPEEEVADEDEWPDEEAPVRRPRRRAEATAQPRRRLRLMDLCTPVFACTALLPRGTGAGMQPAYASFRQEVMTALQRIEREAQDHGIDREDAKDAVYALALFVDEQVAASQWTAKDQWAAEPLHIVLNQDPEGGVNFFRKLQEMGDRRKAAKEVYLVCLAFGFRGKYATMDQVQQTAQLAEERQRILRDIHPSAMERMRRLFPEAYAPASALEVRVPPAPRWWWIASAACVLVCIVVWVVLFLNAPPEEDTIRAVREAAGAARTSP